ncbi:MAG: RlmE family RNA methyltransferase [Thermoplasmatota archaeon]
MTRWYTEKKREHYYREAKKQGYRARSSYKLKQIQQKFRIFQSGDVVVDLGAAPGGWSQVAKEYVGDAGFIVGIDLQWIVPIDGVVFLQGDIADASSIKTMEELLEGRRVKVILSDMAPNISGNYSIDHAKSIFLAEQSLTVVDTLLRKGGYFVCKVFMGEMLDEFIVHVQHRFSEVRRFSPPASRKSSSELYIVGKYYKKE